MSLRNRLLAPLSAALVGSLVGSLLLLAPAPAQAATKGDVAGHSRGPDAVFKRSSYLCYGYADCREKGMGNAGYAQANDKMYWRMYSGHNCTNYAAYRMVKSGMPNERPWSGSGNAMYWGTSMPRITDDVPRDDVEPTAAKGRGSRPIREGLAVVRANVPYARGTFTAAVLGSFAYGVGTAASGWVFGAAAVGGTTKSYQPPIVAHSVRPFSRKCASVWPQVLSQVAGSPIKA